MKFLISVIGLAVLFSFPAGCPVNENSEAVVTDVPGENVLMGCPENPDRLYDRQKILDQFDSILKASIPEYVKYPALTGGFFIYDLTDPSNKYRSQTPHAPAEGCINFIDKHVYHFSVVYFPFSKSHIAILENGKPKVFNSINCEDSSDKLEDVVRYTSKMLENDKNRDDVIVRLKNYRRYGFYRTTDERRVSCDMAEKIPENSDKLYDRRDTLKQLSDILRSSAPELIRKYYPPFFVEGAKANGFFIYDLTEPSNRQTSLLERVNFKNNHAYHFAYIDLPFSFSNIAILEDGKMKIFKAINCEGKGDTLQDVVDYLSQKFKADKNKEETIDRVKTYRKYGVYASFNGLSTPQCEEVRSDTNRRSNNLAK